jgi:malonate-semialdehyde dehydrogenase (acetylating)/methylmalonate-semialdehyde dehydrogenase
MASKSTPGATAIRRLHATSRQLSVASATSTSTSTPSYPVNHDPVATPQDTPNFLDNQFVPSQASTWLDLHDPATNHLVTRVPQSTDAELMAAVDSAERAFAGWRDTSLLARQQIMFKYVALIRQHWDRLAASITIEQGKTVADAKGDVLRGLQIAETACAIPQQMMGEVLEVAKNMETKTVKEPLGVVAAICPFSTYILVFFFFILSYAVSIC